MRKPALLALVWVLCTSPPAAQRLEGIRETAARGIPVSGNPAALLKAYERWKESSEDREVLLQGRPALFERLYATELSLREPARSLHGGSPGTKLRFRPLRTEGDGAARQRFVHNRG